MTHVLRSRVLITTTLGIVSPNIVDFFSYPNSRLHCPGLTWDHTCTPFISKFLGIRLLLACLMGQYCFARWRLSASVVCRRRLLSSVTLPAGRPACRQARGRSGGRHFAMGQSYYVPFGRHFVILGVYLYINICVLSLCN